MKIKSLITHTALLLVSIIVLAACDLFGGPKPTPTPTPPPPVVTPAKELSFATYFNNAAVVSYTELANELPQGTKYNLIDKQLSTFTDNLFRRILAVYGPGFYWDESTGTGETIADLKLIGDGDTYSPHKLSSNEIIMKLPHNNTNIGKLADALKTGQWDASKQIVSQYNLKNSMTTWNYSLKSTENELEAYESYLGEHFNNIKLEIAKLVAGSNSTNYSNVLNSITKFNLNNHQKQISDYILNTVIGSDIKNQSGKLYGDLILQLVNTTLAHREVEAIPTWPELNFVKEVTGITEPITNKQIKSNKYTSVKVMPRVETPITKLNLKLKSSNNLNGLEMTVRVYREGRSIGTKTFTSITNDKAFYIDLNSFTGSYISLPVNTNTYIEFTFTNPNDLSFNMIFEGYFDKV